MGNVRFSILYFGQYFHRILLFCGKNIFLLKLQTEFSIIYIVNSFLVETFECVLSILSELQGVKSIKILNMVEERLAVGWFSYNNFWAIFTIYFWEIQCSSLESLDLQWCLKIFFFFSNKQCNTWCISNARSI